KLLPKSDDSAVTRAATLVEEALLEVLKERGVELVRSAFAQAPMTSEGSVGLYSTLNRASGSLDDDEIRFTFVKYMVDVLTRPAPSLTRFINMGCGLASWYA